MNITSMVILFISFTFSVSFSFFIVVVEKNQTFWNCKADYSVIWAQYDISQDYGKVSWQNPSLLQITCDKLYLVTWFSSKKYDTMAIIPGVTNSFLYLWPNILDQSICPAFCFLSLSLCDLLAKSKMRSVVP